MDVLNLLDRLDTYLQECSRLPLVGKLMVDEDEVFDLIDALQAAIPQEFERANWVLKEREQILQEARKEAQGIVKDAQSQIAAQVSEHVIAKEARAQAEQLVFQAQSVAGEIHLGAREYADELMKRVEELLIDIIERVKKNRQELGVFSPELSEANEGGSHDQETDRDVKDQNMEDNWATDVDGGDEQVRSRKRFWNSQD